MNPSFQGVNRHSRYYLSTAKLENYNIIIDGKDFLYQTIVSYIKAYVNIQHKNYNWSHRWLLIFHISHY